MQQKKTSRLNKAQSSWFILPIWNQSHSLNSRDERTPPTSKPMRMAPLDIRPEQPAAEAAESGGGGVRRPKQPGHRRVRRPKQPGGAGGRSSRGAGGRSSRGSGGRSSQGGGRQAACGGRLPELPKGPVQPERLKQPEQLRPGWPRCNRITGLERKRRSRAMRRRRRRRWLW